MNVEQLVAERIATARRRIQQQQQQRAAFAERRTYGVAARHRTKQARTKAANPPAEPVPSHLARVRETHPDTTGSRTRT